MSIQRIATRLFLIVVLVVLTGFSTNVWGQAIAIDKLTPALATVGERHAAEIGSNVTVAAVVAFDVWHAWQSENRTRALVLSGARYGVAQGASFALKKLFARRRPCITYAEACGADDPDFSFPSGHTATAFTATGGARLAITLPLSLGTGGLRIAAGKHWLTDTLAGASIGLLASRIRMQP